MDQPTVCLKGVFFLNFWFAICDRSLNWNQTRLVVYINIVTMADWRQLVFVWNNNNNNLLQYNCLMPNFERMWFYLNCNAKRRFCTENVIELLLICGHRIRINYTFCLARHFQCIQILHVSELCSFLDYICNNFLRQREQNTKEKLMKSIYMVMKLRQIFYGQTSGSM